MIKYKFLDEHSGLLRSLAVRLHLLVESGWRRVDALVEVRVGLGGGGAPLAGGVRRGSHEVGGVLLRLRGGGQVRIAVLDHVGVTHLLLLRLGEVEGLDPLVRGSPHGGEVGGGGGEVDASRLVGRRLVHHLLGGGDAWW